MRDRIRAALVLGALLAPLPMWGQHPGVVRFCVGAGNPPMSQQGSPAGYEVELVRAVAARAELDPHFVWLDLEEEVFEQALRDGRCDAAVGTIADPGRMAQRPDLTGLALTRPYYATGYILLRHPDAPPLRALPDAGDTRIGVEGESIATYTLRQRGRRVHVLFDLGAVVSAVAAGEARYGYVWGPVAAWMVRDRQDVLVSEQFESPDWWPFALAVRAEDAALRERLDAAIASVLADGTTDRICRRYGLPRCTPAG